MMPASTNAGGQAMGTPDTCKVPAPPSAPVPTPFPNIGMLTDAKGNTCSKKVKFGNKKVINMQTEIAKSSGDEAGTAGGIVSGKNMGECLFKLASNTVKVEGKKAVYANCMTSHNGTSANFPAGTQVAPSQTKVKIMP